MPSSPALLVAMVALGVQAGPVLAAGEDRAAVDRGRRLLSQYQCGSCHAIPGVASAGGQVAQPLGAWKHRVYIAGRLPNRADVLARWIAAPQALIPGTPMPSMGVAPDDARAMAAYLLSLE